MTRVLWSLTCGTCLGLPAANVDLRDGDVILEVEGTDVRRVTGHQVVEIVR